MITIRELQAIIQSLTAGVPHKVYFLTMSAVIAYVLGVAEFMSDDQNRFVLFFLSLCVILCLMRPQHPQGYLRILCAILYKVQSAGYILPEAGRTFVALCFSFSSFAWYFREPRHEEAYRIVNFILFALTKGFSMGHLYKSSVEYKPWLIVLAACICFLAGMVAKITGDILLNRVISTINSIIDTLNSVGLGRVNQFFLQGCLLICSMVLGRRVDFRADRVELANDYVYSSLVLFNALIHSFEIVLMILRKLI